jgi:hypothetical protein
MSRNHNADVQQRKFLSVRWKHIVGPVFRGDLAGNHILFIPLLHGGTMKRHPCFVHRNNILAARDWSDNSPAWEEMPDRQRTPERWRIEIFVSSPKAAI